MLRESGLGCLWSAPIIIWPFDTQSVWAIKWLHIKMTPHKNDSILAPNKHDSISALNRSDLVLILNKNGSMRASNKSDSPLGAELGLCQKMSLIQMKLIPPRGWTGTGVLRKLGWAGILARDLNCLVGSLGDAINSQRALCADNPPTQEHQSEGSREQKILP